MKNNSKKMERKWAKWAEIFEEAIASCKILRENGLVPYSTRAIEERRSLNGMWTKSKGKLIVLRLACGLDSRGHGEVTRNHILTPKTPGNAMLQCAMNLVEDEMMVADHHHDTEAEFFFHVTPKGQAKASKRGWANGKNNCEEIKEPFSREVAYNELIHAQEDILEARRDIVDHMAGLLKLSDTARAHYYHEIDEEITECLTSLGRASYMLLHPTSPEVLKGASRKTNQAYA